MFYKFEHEISGIFTKHFRSSRIVRTSETTVSECHICNRPVQGFPSIPHQLHVCVAQKKISSRNTMFYKFEHEISGISTKHFRSSRSVRTSETAVSECHICNRPVQCFPSIPHHLHVCVTQKSSRNTMFYKLEHMKFLEFLRSIFDLPELSTQVRPQFPSAIFETAQSSAFQIYLTNPTYVSHSRSYPRNTIGTAVL
jgi:ribosomal protein L34E